MPNRTPASVVSAMIAGCALLVACDGEREAKSETAVSEAEVSTDAPASQVTDQQLQQAAADAANAAASAASTTTPAGDAAAGATPAAPTAQ
jgi:hypothetical protein